MNVIFLLILGCAGGGRAWTDGAERALDDDTGAGDTAADTDPDDTVPDDDTDVPADSGLAPLEGDPCTRPIPAEALVVRGDVTADADGAVAWVCRNGTWSTGGDRVQTFLESRGDALLSGTGGRAWVRAGGRLLVYAGPNEVWIEKGAEITVEAEGVEVTTCPAIVFTGGAGDGC